MVSSCRVGVDANSHADLHVVNTQVAAAPAVVQSCIVVSSHQSSRTYASHELFAAEGLDSHSRTACSANQAAPIADLTVQHMPGQVLDGALRAPPIAVNKEQQAHLAHAANSLDNGFCCQHRACLPC